MTTMTDTTPQQPPGSNQESSSPLFDNPYKNVSAGDVIRLQCYVSNQDHLFIKLIRPGNGTIRGVLGILWHKLCNSLRDNDITDYTKVNEFEHFLSNSILVDKSEYECYKSDSIQWRQHQASLGHLSDASSSGQDSADRGVVSETAGGNVRKRAKRVR